MAFRLNRDWLDRVRPLLERATWQTPGSLIEYKGDSLAWHYRMSDPLQAVETGQPSCARASTRCSAATSWKRSAAAR